MAQTQRLLDSKQVLTIMNRRLAIPANLVGEKVRFSIRGNGTVVDVKTKAGELVQSVVDAGTVFQKVIFNLDANSGIAMSNAAVRQLSKDAMIAERAGDKEQAHKLFNEFLNKVQMSFSIPTTASILEQLGDRVDIVAEVVKITTENGSLLTIDPNTIRVAGPVKASKTVFSFDAEEPVAEGGDNPLVDGAEPVVTGSTAEELNAELNA